MMELRGHAAVWRNQHRGKLTDDRTRDHILCMDACACHLTVSAADATINLAVFIPFLLVPSTLSSASSAAPVDSEYVLMPRMAPAAFGHCLGRSAGPFV